MEKISFTHLNNKKKEKVPKYEFQQICLEIAKLTGVNKGLCFALWKHRGWEIKQILAEIKQGEIKNPKIYIKYLLKKWVGKNT